MIYSGVARLLKLRGPAESRKFFREARKYLINFGTICHQKMVEEGVAAGHISFCPPPRTARWRHHC